MKVLPAALLMTLAAGGAAARTPTEREMQLFREGNQAYETSDYEGARKAYQALVDLGLESRDLHYNLGNACLKSGRLGAAILNYRRALRIDPSDEDAGANLAYARRRTQDVAPQAALDPLPWLRALRPGGERAGVMFLLTLNLAALFFGAGRGLRRPPGFLGPVTGTSFVLAFLLGLLFLFEVRSEGGAREGVVVRESADVRAGPGEDYTVAFVIHEGTEASLGRSTAGWTEVTVTPELKGWLVSDAVELIE